MGLFDFLRKKESNVVSYDEMKMIDNSAEMERLRIENEKKKVVYEKKVAELDLLNTQKNLNQLTDKEKDFLNYVNGMDVIKPKIARRWQDVNLQTAFDKFFSQGLVALTDMECTLRGYCNAELIELLASKGIATDGKKEVLIQRIISEIPEEDIIQYFPKRKIILTEKGEKICEQHKNKQRDTRFRNASTALNEALRKGDTLEICRGYSEITEVYYEEKAYNDMAQAAWLAFYFLLHEPFTVSDYKKRECVCRYSYILTPNTTPIRLFLKSEKEGIFSRKEIISFIDDFSKENPGSLIPNSPVSVSDAKKILNMCLDANCEKASAYLNKLHDKFWKHQFDF